MLGRVPLPSLPLPNLHHALDRSTDQIRSPLDRSHEPNIRASSPRSTKSSEEKQKAFSIDALVSKSSPLGGIQEQKVPVSQSVNPMLAMLQSQLSPKMSPSPNVSNSMSSISNFMSTNPLLSQTPMQQVAVAQAALYQKIAMQQKLQQLQQQQMIAQQLLSQQAATTSSVEMIQQLAEIQKRVAIQNLTGQIWSSNGHPMAPNSVTSPNGSLAASRDNSTSSTSGSDKDSDSPKPIEMLAIC